MSLQRGWSLGDRCTKRPQQASVPVQNAEPCTVPLMRGFLLGRMLSLTTLQAAVPVHGCQSSCCRWQ